MIFKNINPMYPSSYTRLHTANIIYSTHGSVNPVTLKSKPVKNTHVCIRPGIQNNVANVALKEK